MLVVAKTFLFGADVAPASNGGIGIIGNGTMVTADCTRSILRTGNHIQSSEPFAVPPEKMLFVETTILFGANVAAAWSHHLASLATRKRSPWLLHTRHLSESSANIRSWKPVDTNSEKIAFVTNRPLGRR